MLSYYMTTNLYKKDRDYSMEINLSGKKIKPVVVYDLRVSEVSEKCMYG